MVNGYYYAAFDTVSMECYDPPPGARTDGSKSYIYTDNIMTNQSIEITNDDHILGSFLATGLDMSKGDTKNDGGDVATIPGLSGTGPGSSNHDNGTSSGDPSNSGSGDPLQGTVTATGTGSAATGFVQDSGNGAAPIGNNPEQVLQGSLFAVMVAMVALCVL
jgi:hypothetical protein